jgi:Tfp pilus assembly protein PilN
MKCSSYHLNLLKETERSSSSPVRMRVMAPLVGMLACVGMVIWCISIMMQTMLVKSQSRAIESDLAAKKASHKEVLDKQANLRERTLQLEQLQYYKSGIRRIAEPLAKLAEVMPLKVQLTELNIKAPPQQVFTKPGAKKPLLGPTTTTEEQKIVFSGRATTPDTILALMNSLKDPAFANLLTGTPVTNARDSEKVMDGRKLLAFDVEYSMPERKFEK